MTSKIYNLCQLIINVIKRTIINIRQAYITIYKDDRLQKIIHELENEQRFTKEFLRNYDPFHDFFCTLRLDKCASCGLMYWHKDKDHKYLNANDTHLKTFFHLEHEELEKVIGKSDIELVENWKEETGKENTFGEMCVSTDEYVRIIGEPCRFFEFGYRDGLPLFLDVFKKPLFDNDDNFVGTIGNALDLSDRESDIVDLLQFYMSIGVAKRIDKGNSRAVAAYRILDRRKKFNREFPR